MKVQKGGLFALALALCMTVGLFSIQAVIPIFDVPVGANIAMADPDDAVDPTTLMPEDMTMPETEMAYPEEGLEGELAEGIEAISEELDETAEGLEAAAEEQVVDDGMETSILPMIGVIVVLLISAGTAYFFATKKPKAPKAPKE